MLLIFLFGLIVNSQSKTLDNRLIGTPNVSCGPESLLISAESEDIFEGQIYIKTQRRSSPDCYSVYSVDNNSTHPEFALPLSRISSCGLEMRRETASKGLQLSAVIVFAFHPSFVTAGDRAFAVHCIFQQKDYTVATRFDFVGDIEPVLLEGISEIPSVELTVVPGRLPHVDTTDPRIPSVQIGQPLMLVWHLSTDSIVYGIRVLDCVARSRDNLKAMEVLVNGCSTDPKLITDVRYSDEHHRAFSDVTAFKFPDEEEVFFRCHVKLCIRKFEHLILTGKSEGDLCYSSPSCDVVSDRKRRSDDQSHLLNDQLIIVVHGRMSVKDKDTPHTMAQTAEETLQETYCMHRNLFAIGSAISITVYTVTVASLIMMIYFKLRRKTVNL